MKILRYTEQVQRQLGSKTKPEPWLHAAIIDDPDYDGSLYAIYVWDTRQVVEGGSCIRLTNAINGTRANDNRQPLCGGNAASINEAFKGGDKPTANADLSSALTKAINKAKATYQRELNQLFEDSIIRFLPIDVVKSADARQLTDLLNRRLAADCKRRRIQQPNYFDASDVQEALRKYSNATIGKESVQPSIESADPRKEALRQQAVEYFSDKLHDKIGHELMMAPDAYIEIMRKSDWYAIFNEILKRFYSDFNDQMPN